MTTQPKLIVTPRYRHGMPYVADELLNLPVDPVALAVLVRVLYVAGERARAERRRTGNWPTEWVFAESAAAIAWHTGLDMRTVKRALKRLVAQGVLEPQPVRLDAERGNLPREYRVTDANTWPKRVPPPTPAASPEASP